MTRTLTAASLAAAAALALPTAAGAATPRAGTWLNSSHSHGAEFVVKGRQIEDLRLYCQNTSFELFDFVHVGRGGSFSFRGTARRWGPEHQWWGDYTVRVTGRFVSSKRVRLARSTPQCKKATSSVRRFR